MPAITLEQIATPVVPRLERFPLPECGADAYVNIRELSARDLVALREQHGGKGDSDNLPFVQNLLALTLADDEGRPLFRDAAHLAAGFGLSLNRLQELTERSLAFSGLQVAEKNSPPRNATS